MPLGAISLRNNAECCKPQANKAQNFGLKNHDGEHKNHKAAYISASVGFVAALAVVAYMFRGKIAQTPLFKKAVNLGTETFNKAKTAGSDALGKMKETGSKLADKTKEMTDKVSESAKEVYQNAVKKAENIIKKPNT